MTSFTSCGAGQAPVADTKVNVTGCIARSVTAMVAPRIVVCSSTTVSVAAGSLVTSVSCPDRMSPPRSVPITAAGGRTATRTSSPGAITSGSTASTAKPPVGVASSTSRSSSPRFLITRSTPGGVRIPHSLVVSSKAFTEATGADVVLGSSNPRRPQAVAVIVVDHSTPDSQRLRLTSPR
ncbi:MAG: hypothetical protein IPQ07_12745 [Myxococcales bacterium]|nr:hypothetical protein [Myxococcales bacterium]